jgi:hypothetical protein
MKVLAVGAAAAQGPVDFLNSANVVARYAAAVNGTTLPVLVTPPPGYGDFSDALAVAKLHAMSWVQEMVPTFTEVPSAVVALNAVVQSQLSSVLDQLTALQQNPGDSGARAAIATALQTLETELDPLLRTVTDLDSWIATYSALITPDASSLRALSDQLATAEGVDATQVAKLGAVVASLHELIDSRNELATLDTIGNAVFAIFLAVEGAAIGAPFSGPAAIVVGVLFGGVTGGITTFFPVVSPPDYEQSLQDIQLELDAVQTEIGAVNSIIGQLQLTATQFDELVTSAAAAKEDAGQVLTFWQQWQTGLSTLLADLGATLDDLATGGNLSTAITEVQAAQRSWGALEALMSPLSGMSYAIRPGVHMPVVSPHDSGISLTPTEQAISEG